MLIRHSRSRCHTKFRKLKLISELFANMRSCGLLRIILLICCCFTLSIGASENELPRRYDGFSLYRVTPSTEEQLAFLNQTDFWIEPREVGSACEVMIAPDEQDDFEAVLKQKSLKFSIAISDVQKGLDEFSPQKLTKGAASTVAFRSGQPSDDFQLNQYHRHEEIQAYLKALAKEHPQITSRFSLGYSWEGRQLSGIKIGKPSGFSKKAIFIDAGIHAREWVAPATALYFINQLVKRYDKDINARELVNDLDWYIVPILNPDGNEYTWTTDRLWRGTRSRHHCNITSCCIGVDANRNFDDHFAGAGTSHDPCSRVYHGPNAFSEPEVAALRDFLVANNETIVAYFGLHSYSQLWVLPYGYHKPSAYPSDYDDLLAAAKAGVDAIKAVHGAIYRAGTISDLLYEASGGACDWVKSATGIKHAATIEMRPSRGNPVGFLLPPDQLIANGEEIYEGIRAFTKHIGQLYLNAA